MKKRFLVLLTFVPIVVGYIINLTILIPGIGGLLYYVLPLLTTIFWFYLGRQFAHTTWKSIPCILIGNATGIISVLIYLWQRLLETEHTRNLFLTGVSQMFSGSAPGYLLAGIALLFEREPNTIGTASAVTLQILSVVYMIAVFSCAVLFEKNRMKKSSNSST